MKMKERAEVGAEGLIIERIGGDKGLDRRELFSFF